MNTSEIAIIGMACRFPMANSVNEFWQNLCQGKECLTRFSEAELITAGVSASVIKNPHFVPVKGILTDIDKFDAGFFRMSPADASIMDPQQRVFLECAWEALEHAANIPNKNHNPVISAFAGIADSCYLQENLLKNQKFRQHYNWFQARIAAGTGTLSTKLSYRLNLRGNSVNLNTACSTGLVAVIHACQDLLLGRSDLALAGAVAIELPQMKGYLYETGGIDSLDGHCRPFAHNANGTVFSNGVGVIVLKRLADAVADRDTVYAVIKGYGINNDGSDKLNYFAPSVSGQAACIRAALTHANISAADMGFVEAHGTATALGDFIEVKALNQVYRQFTKRKQYCALGSVKSNIGHADVSAGIASLIKTALCLYHQRIPATLHFDKPNPKIGYEDSPFYVNSQLMQWSPDNQYAGVSAFGVGGTNSHIILAGYASSDIASLKSSTYQDQLIIVSAKSSTALQQSILNLNDYLNQATQSDPPIDLANVSYTLQTGRDEFMWRSIAVGKNTHDITAALKTAQSIRGSAEDSSVIFMFPGQGSQYPLMAYQLYQKIPFFKRIMNQCEDIVRPHLPVNLCELLYSSPPDSRLNDTTYAQVILFIVEYALSQLLIHYGVKPAFLVGHSSGEYVAACLAGVFSLEDALFLICQRGKIMEKTSEGKMLAISCSIEEFENYQKLFPIELAAHNTINQCVATGGIEEITGLMQHLKLKNKFSQLLKVNHAFHSQFMEPIYSSFYSLMGQIQLFSPQLPIISNVTGNLLTAEEATDPGYWYRHLRYPVQFKKSIDTLALKEQPFFLEVGPGHVLSYFVQQSIPKKREKWGAIHTLPNEQKKILITSNC